MKTKSTKRIGPTYSKPSVEKALVNLFQKKVVDFDMLLIAVETQY